MRSAFTRHSRACASINDPFCRIVQRHPLFTVHLYSLSRHCEKISACARRLAHGRNPCPNSSGHSRRICCSLNHGHGPSRDYERIRDHIPYFRNIRTVHPFRYDDAPCRVHAHTRGHSPSNRNSGTSNSMPQLQSQLQPQQQSKLDSSFSHSFQLIFNLSIL